MYFDISFNAFLRHACYLRCTFFNQHLLSGELENGPADNYHLCISVGAGSKAAQVPVKD